jgi:hypothetical protein
MHEGFNYPSYSSVIVLRKLEGSRENGIDRDDLRVVRRGPGTTRVLRTFIASKWWGWQSGSMTPCG